jgi:hypothetical protein
MNDAEHERLERRLRDHYASTADRLPEPVVEAARSRIRGATRRWLLVVAAALITMIGIVGSLSILSPREPLPTTPPTASATDDLVGSPDPALKSFHGEGISFDYPADWDVSPSRTRFSMGSTIAIVGTSDVSACGDPVDINCAYAAVLEPGDIRVVIGTGASPVGSVEEPPGGFTAIIDGMPGVARDSGPIAQTKQEAGRSWQIGMPGVVNDWYTIDAAMRGPGVEDLRAQVDAVARSFRFDQHPPALPDDPDKIDEIVARAIQALDRDARESNHSKYYACFPRRVGASDPIEIADGPGGPLPGPIRVRCAVSIDVSPVGLFKMTLSASWEAGPDHPADSYSQTVYVDGEGTVEAMYNVDDTFFPVADPRETPGPPIELEAGTLVEVLYPGVTLWRETNHDDSLSSMAHGERLWIVDGPVTAGGERWYRVRWHPTPTFDEIPAWITDSFEGHAVVKAVEPRCPVAVRDVADLVGITAAERLRCFAHREVSLGPVTFREAKNKTAAATGSPKWLASSAVIAMYGSGGPEGVDGPLLVRADAHIDALPVSGWFDVVGHFDDPAARGCHRAWADAGDSGPSPETKAEQELSCREQFVVTGIKAR